MVVSVEISGLLERKLRRLVELGVYASVAEAVRDAVRKMMEEMDLRALALELYVTREASLHYVSEFAGETFQGMIDYMIARGVTPVIGALAREDYEPPGDGEAILDGLSVYVIYKSRLGDLVAGLRRQGLTLLAPRQLSSYTHILAAERIRRGLPLPEGVEEVDVEVEQEERPGLLLTPLEVAVIEYARSSGAALISDDRRTREAARRMGVRAYSSLSLVTHYLSSGEPLPGDMGELILSLRAIPLIVPAEAYEAWGRNIGL